MDHRQGCAVGRVLQASRVPPPSSSPRTWGDSNPARLGRGRRFPTQARRIRADALLGGECRGREGSRGDRAARVRSILGLQQPGPRLWHCSKPSTRSSRIARISSPFSRDATGLSPGTVPVKKSMYCIEHQYQLCCACGLVPAVQTRGHAGCLTGRQGFDAACGMSAVGLRPEASLFRR
jgi:hypothetical protein